MASMAGNQEQQTAAVAEHTVDQDKCSSGGVDGSTATAVVVAPKRKVRMHPSDVRFILSMKPEDIGGSEYLDAYAHKFTPEELEERKRQHEEVAAMLRDEDGELAARQAEVRSQLAEKGYVETPSPTCKSANEPDWANEEEFDKWASAQWESMTEKPWFKNHKFADSLHGYEGPGWIVRPFDAEEDEDEEYEYDDEEYEYDNEEGEVDVEVEDEKEDKVEDQKEDANVQAHSGGETAAHSDKEDANDQKEDEDEVEVEDEKKDANVKAHSDRETAALESN